MAGLNTPTILAIVLFFGLSLFVTNVDGGPATVTGDIHFGTETYPIIMNEDETLEDYEVDGWITVSKTDVHALAAISAVLTISDPGWNPEVRPNQWESVQNDEQYEFTVYLDIPNGSRIHEQNTYSLEVVLYNSLGNEVGRGSGGFTTEITEIISTGDDDDSSDDDDIISPVDDESFPLWPFFILFIVIGLVVAAIWIKRNIEVVGEEDGSRRIMFREKDSGHIVGRKKQPPPEPELDL